MITINYAKATHSIASYQLANTSAKLEKSVNRLSNGYKINSSIEDPSGLAVSSRLQSNILQSSAVHQNLTNTLSFLETQNSYLQRVGSILTRIQEIEILKKDTTKTNVDIEFYNDEKLNLVSEIYQIKDEKFNGVRLFSPDSDMDSMFADTQTINNSTEEVEQPPLIYQGDNKPLELVFLCDYTGSMSSTRNELINTINSFAATLDAKVAGGTIPSWKARVMVYGDWNSYNNNNFIRATSDFTSLASSDAAQIKSQTESFPFPMFPGKNVPGQNPLDESPIDAIGYAINNTSWSSDANKGMILFTDHGSMPPNGSFGSISTIANNVKNKDINLFIYGDDDTATYPNEELMTFVGESGATFTDFANRGNMATTLDNFIQSVLGPEHLIDFENLTKYISENISKQNRIRGLLESNALLKSNTEISLSKIKDLDYAEESVKMTINKLLQDVGTAYIAQANIQMNNSLLQILL